VVCGLLVGGGWGVTKPEPAWSAENVVCAIGRHRTRGTQPRAIPPYASGLTPGPRGPVGFRGIGVARSVALRARGTERAERRNVSWPSRHKLQCSLSLDENQLLGPPCASCARCQAFGDV
jgi:hypothetical protein